MHSVIVCATYLHHPCCFVFPHPHLPCTLYLCLLHSSSQPRSSTLFKTPLHFLILFIIHFFRALFPSGILLLILPLPVLYSLETYQLSGYRELVPEISWLQSWLVTSQPAKYSQRRGPCPCPEGCMQLCCCSVLVDSTQMFLNRLHVPHSQWIESIQDLTKSGAPIWPWFRYMVSDGLGFRFRLFNREKFPRSLVNWYRKKDI